VRGSWFGVQGFRFPLEVRDAWNQVEVVQVHDRFECRVGGRLQGSCPSNPPGLAPAFESDGDIAYVTVSSVLEDPGLHELPASSVWAWRWGGQGAVALELAVAGSIELVAGGESHLLEGERHAFRYKRVRFARGSGEIVARAGPEGATVTDVFVRARSTRP
jgi:hypothetical protein